MRVLAFGAHPDDIEFRMAGTLMKMKNFKENFALPTGKAAMTVF
mgnify:CR=1 FL=1